MRRRSGSKRTRDHTGAERLTLVYRLDRDEWRGVPRMQLMVEDLLPPG